MSAEVKGLQVTLRANIDCPECGAQMMFELHGKQKAIVCRQGGCPLSGALFVRPAEKITLKAIAVEGEAGDK